MAKRKTKYKKKRRARPRQEEYPGWMWMIFGLAIGLSVAFAIYMKDREPSVAMRAAEPQPASMSATMDQPATSPSPPPATEEKTAERRFDFYDMLPNFEVVIPEEESDVSQDANAEPIVKPGVYVLQAGSFASYSDADRRRAQIALQGISSRIQKVSIDEKTYHRVRIGPLDDLDELNHVRNQLRLAQIDVLRIRLGD